MRPETWSELRIAKACTLCYESRYCAVTMSVRAVVLQQS